MTRCSSKQGAVPPLTICTECTFHLRQTAYLAGIEQDFCKHPKVKVRCEIDPVTGESIYQPPSFQGMPACRSINKGNCEHYQPKNS